MLMEARTCRPAPPSHCFYFLVNKFKSKNEKKNFYAKLCEKVSPKVALHIEHKSIMHLPDTLLLLHI